MPIYRYICIWAVQRTHITLNAMFEHIFLLGFSLTFDLMSHKPEPLMNILGGDGEMGK